MELKYKGITGHYRPHTEEDESTGILIVKHSNGIESTHVITNWGLIRIFQYFISMYKLD